MVRVTLRVNDAPIDSAETDPGDVPLQTIMYLSRYDMASVLILSTAIEAVVFKNANGTYWTSWKLRNTDTMLSSRCAIVSYNETQLLEWCLIVSSFNSKHLYKVADPVMVSSTPCMTDVVPSGVV